jgi:surface antigen
MLHDHNNRSDAGYYGHVAFVERVNSNGSILVSEMNFSASPGTSIRYPSLAAALSQLLAFHQ